jgi:methylenetetrahydrofolate dehydrogenase (NADP+)/methenyltetrahydrofolate cyclohydrolase
MTARIIDGKAAAADLRAKVAQAVADFRQKTGRPPGLATVLVGEDPASAVYVRSKVKATAEAGLESFAHHLPDTLSEAELLAIVDKLNRDPAVDGILVQLPLPKQIDAQRVIEAINPDKDVDGFHPVNAGRLATGLTGLVPCTPFGCLYLLRKELGDLSGKDAVVIGRSNIVGKPIAMLMLEREATVTITHIETKDLPDICRKADVIVAAAGAPRLVRGYWVKPGAVIIDVGITRMKGDDGKTKLVGDVAFEEVQHARAITPVPGGVGPMTISCLLANTVQAAREQLEGTSSDGFSIDWDDLPDRSMFTGETSEASA